MWVNLPIFRRGCQLQSYLVIYIFHTQCSYFFLGFQSQNVLILFLSLFIHLLFSKSKFISIKIKLSRCAAKNLFFISLFFASQHQFVLSLSFGSFQPYCSYSSFLRKCATSTLPGSCDCCEWFKKDHWIMTWFQWKDELRNRVQGLVELEKAGM